MTTPVNNNGTLLRTDHGTLGRPMRLALYSHDAMGVGHVRRNMLIAQTFSEGPLNATSLMLCGVHEASAFACGQGIDCMTLPALRKHSNDDYRPRDLRLDYADVRAIRQATLKSSLLAYRPDILLVDKLPRGLQGELDIVIPRLRAQGTRIVFGMRDVLDSADRVALEWGRQGNAKFIQQHYDAVWVYGDPHVFDPIHEYGLTEIQHKVRYTGYIDQCERLQYAADRSELSDEQLTAFQDVILCMVGGGEDGVDLAMAFAGCRLPPGREGLMVAGPLMSHQDRRVLEAAVKQRPDMHFIGSVREADLLTARAERVICMGGYNSTVAVVSFDKPALIVPRVSPRAEQYIRAQRFAQMGLVDVLHPDHLSAECISAWLAQPVRRTVNGRAKLNIDGLKHMTRFATDLLSVPWQPVKCPLHKLEVTL